MIINADCKDVIKKLIDDGVQIDAIITDPPYELGFMNRSWDKTGIAYDVEMWRLCLQVLKPGGHLLSFGGARTYHRMAVAIEDAGFEVRDCIRYMGQLHYPAWAYGQGFPKSLNIGCKCTNNQLKSTDGNALQISSHQELSDLQSTVSVLQSLSGSTEQDMQQALYEESHRQGEQRQASAGAKKGFNSNTMSCLQQQGLESDMLVEEHKKPDMLLQLQRQSESEKPCKVQRQYEGKEALLLSNRGEQSSMERRGNLLQKEGELYGCSVCEMPERISVDGEEGRLHHGASISNGNENKSPAIESGSSAPYRPQPIEQSPRQFNAVSKQRGTQANGKDTCEKCGGLINYKGFGSALKPAWEPIVLARKPLSEPTIAENVLKYGTGGLNIDGCRVETNNNELKELNRPNKRPADGASGFMVSKDREFTPSQGRFPANLIHDGSEEVEDEFAKYGESKSSDLARLNTAKAHNHTESMGKSSGDWVTKGHDDKGTASRFYYCAKASKKERRGSKHPTVKPIALMRYLCRLITPPGGTILDPFAGTGATGEAAKLEGFKYILIEKEEQYIKDIERRLDRCTQD